MKVKTTSVATLGIAVLFYFFFQYTKHDPALRLVNFFNQDPYDAVGSFGIQLALVAAVLSLFRKKLRKVVLASILITLVADIIALVRFFPLWAGKPAGLTLAMLTAGMVLLTVLFLQFVDKWKIDVKKSLLVSLICTFILAFYPKAFTSGIVGGIFTAATGMVIFFISVWTWMNFPKPQTKHLGWILIVGALIGLGVAGLEMISEGGSPHKLSQLLIIMFVFIGIEGTGVLLGYILLGETFLSILKELLSETHLKIKAMKANK